MTHSQTQGAEGAGTNTAGQAAYGAAIADLRYAPQWSDMAEADHQQWDRVAAAILTKACEPWELCFGDPPECGGPLHGVFVAGMAYTERLLAKLLGVTHYEGGDGSEDFDSDATQTLRNILTGARLWDANENRPVSATPAQPAGAVPDSLRALSEAATAGPFSVSGVRKRYDEASCVIVDAPSCGGLFAFATAEGREALTALADAKFVVAAANHVRDAIAACISASEQAVDDRREIEQLEHELDVAKQERDAAFDRADAAERNAGTEAGWVVANALEGAEQRFRRWGQVGPEWTADRDAALWFARRSDAEAFAAEDEDAWRILPVSALASHPAGQSAGSGAGWAEVVKAICSAVCRVEGLDPDELLQEYESEAHGWRDTDPQWTRYATAVAEVLDALPLPAPDSTRTGQGEATVAVPVEPTPAILEAYWRQTGESREMRSRTEASGKARYAAMIAARPAAPSDAGWRDISTAAPEAQGAWSFDMEAAPRDGTPINVARDNGCGWDLLTVWWSGSDTEYPWHTESGAAYPEHRFDCWARLPAPPASSGQGGR